MKDLKNIQHRNNIKYIIYIMYIVYIITKMIFIINIKTDDYNNTFHYSLATQCVPAFVYALFCIYTYNNMWNAVRRSVTLSHFKIILKKIAVLSSKVSNCYTVKIMSEAKLIWQHYIGFTISYINDLYKRVYSVVCYIVLKTSYYYFFFFTLNTARRI